MVTVPPMLEPPPTAEGSPTPEVLFKEARRRRRRRYGMGGLAITAAAGLAAGLVTSFATSPPPRLPVDRSTTMSSGGYSVSVGGGAAVRSVGLPGFSPSDISSLDGKIWLVGETSVTSTIGDANPHCSVEEINPATMHRIERFSLAACGTYAVAGGGAIYLTVISGVPGTNTETVRLERFDPATGRSALMVPTIVTLSGSADAHCELAYADGSVWFWGTGARGTSSDGLLQISPLTGGVVRRFPDSLLPSDGSPRHLAGQGDHLWLSGEGSGGHEVIEVLTPKLRAPRVIRTTGRYVRWIAAVGDHMWIYAFTNVARPRLLVLGGQGSGVKTVAAPPVSGRGVVGNDGRTFVAGEGRRCDAPLRIWQIRGSSGKARPLLTVRTPYETCLGQIGSAAVDQAAFTFLADNGYPSRLIRVRSGSSGR